MSFPARRPAAGALAWLALVAACGSGEEPAPGTAPAARPPGDAHNLLLVTLDTTRADFVSPFGADPKITPNLSRLAERSWVFTNAVSETNVTNPSHLTLLSGLRAREHRVLSNDILVPDDVRTLPEAFQRAGYATAGLPSAQHLGRQAGWRGFDSLTEADGTLDAPEISHLATRWIDEHADEPFFLWAHFFDPHALYDAPPEITAEFYSGDPTAGDGERIVADDYFRGPKTGRGIRRWLGDARDLAYPRAMYAAEVHYADGAVGEILDALEVAGLTERTVVIVVADHGESLDEHGIYYDHIGLYEPQVRIPLMVSVPGLGAGRSDAFVSTLDVAPTIADLFELPLDERAPGLSLLPLLRGEEGAFTDRGPFVHMSAHNHLVAVRDGRWKLVLTLTSRHHLSRGDELFDLEADPGETTNLLEQHPERVEAMRAFAQPWVQARPLRADGKRLSDEARARLRELGYE